MANTAYMNLNLPVPTVTLGPLYAQQNNTAFETIDQHDHSNGRGVRIKPNGLDISSDLDIKSNNLVNVLSLALFPATILLTGPANTLKVYAYNGNLYFTNGQGATVQITSGGSLVTPPGNAQVFEPQNVSSDITINPADDFVAVRVDTTLARSITLPLAASVAAGRIYKIKDISGLADLNPITINAAGSDEIDGEATLVIDVPYGSFELVGNGDALWDIN